VNYYQHHIGDFNNATRHLNRVERSIYSDLLDLYYDTEKPLTADFDKLARRILVEDNERGALREVLNEFFVVGEDGYHNERCDKEIGAYQRMAEGGKLGAAKRWAKPGDSPPIAPPLSPHTPTQSEGNANHEPVTSNHKPRTINQEPKIQGSSAKAPPFVLPNWINVENWNAWHAGAKRKKATPEQKQVAVNILTKWRDAGQDHAGALENAAAGGYQGLFLPDGKPKGYSGHVNKQEALEASNAAVVERLLAKEALHEHQ
jgi:uncharacterized protein YdaU (DUF1376 family)